jgi:hypothetical protein
MEMVNDSPSQATTEFVLRRLEEPLKIFGRTLPPWTWWVVLGVVVGLGLFYIVWMYIRDSRSVGVWAILLGTLRFFVYAILAAAFLMPAEQTWYEKHQRSRVILMYDVSLSMSTTRDDLPSAGKKFDEMPTRMDKVLNLLNDPEKKFMPRLEANNPVVAYRFARGTDADYRYHDGGKFWPRAEREKLQAMRDRNETPPPGYDLELEHWKSWLLPTVKETLPAGWKDDEERAKELIRQVRENGGKVSSRFYEATAIGESLLEVIKQERNNMVQGIVLFTDGRLTEGSLSAVREAALAAKDANIPIFVVQVGDSRPKVTIDIVDISAPPLIRPEDKWRLSIQVNGQDMQPNVDTFDIALDVTRVKRKPNSKEVENLPLELVEIGEKGEVLADKKITLKQKVTFKTSDAKEKPVFKPGTPPTCQVEFELNAYKIAKAAGVNTEGKKVGMAPDDNSELRFVARIPKDKREITEKTEHESDAADMRVEEKALRVLLVTSVASRDYQYVRTLLAREEQKNRAKLCIHLQQIPDGEKRTGINQDVEAERMLEGFPVKRTLQKGDNPFYSMASYDVVVAFDVDWKTLMSTEQAHMFSDWVFQKGGGFIFVAGPMNTKETASPEHQPRRGEDPNAEPTNPIRYVTRMLPVILQYGDKGTPTTDTPRRLLFPQATSDMEFMRLDETLPKEQWVEGWKKFFNEIQDDDGKTASMKNDAEEPERGIYSYYPVEMVKENARRIATIDYPAAVVEKGKPGETQPFIATGTWGQGKVVYIANGETWRLRMYKDQYHERFWTKLLRDAGSKSANTLNKRITPIMSRYGTVNKYQPFEVRFEDLNGQPLRRDTKLKPKLTVTPPEGVLPEKDAMVTIKDGEHLNREAKVLEVINERDAGGTITRRLRLLVFLDKEKKQTETIVIDSRKVEILYPPVEFKPKLGDKPDATLDKNNDGWFKVEFQPRSAGEYKLRVAFEDSPDNVYNHKFLVKDSNPETDNVKPDPEVLWELASPATKVLARIENPAVKANIRKLLEKKPDLPAAGPDGAPVKKPEADAGDEGARLYFTLDSAQYIPDCMKTDKNDVRNRGKIKDLWDGGWFEVESDSGEKKAVLPYILAFVVGLLSVEWLTRKLLRLA